MCYTVRCEFGEDAGEVVLDWLDWLQHEHVADVIKAGASGAEIVRMDGERVAYEIRYRFPSRLAFEVYERDRAPQLRGEGLARFPLELGLQYSRTVGEVVSRHEG